ncbi:MAG TPA: patatin-like protein [Xanthobacteraceae bacterium]
MREKELRIALVCFGGVSLAVYMHGITKEILKLIRASRALHAIADRSHRAHAQFFDGVDEKDPEYDTEAIYFELLREIGRKIDLRVIVDIIAGASAGGINGTMLARALSHDLPMNALRDLWIDNADVTVLLSPKAKASAWSKFLLRPFIWLAAHYGMSIRDPEVIQKLSLFLRSRWFKPPLDGAIMDDLMYNAAIAMGAPRHPQASLLPSGQSLDLFVTLTDYHGYYELVPLHDPPMIYEVEHHHILRFGYRRWASGEVESDFELANAPALAFAARATSSFPGAFPPARIAEMDALVARHKVGWPTREAFIAKNFRSHRLAGVDATKASFIDGSVLNNRPFREAISAIHGRPAFRQVDRRLVYIDPDPLPVSSIASGEIPSFFSTLRGAMSDIPRTQPVTDELRWVAEFNEQARRIRAIIESARPHVRNLVAATISAPLEEPVSEEQLRSWREQVNAHVARDAGFAYEGYVRLKLISVRQFVNQLIGRLRDVPEKSPLARAIGEIVDTWAARRGLDYNPAEGDALQAESAAPGRLPRWAEFLLAFDVKYRERRLHFMVEGQNRLYERLDRQEYRGLDPQVIDRLKRSFYAKLDDIRNRRSLLRFKAGTHERAKALFATAPSASDLRNLSAYAYSFVERHGDEIDELVEQLTNAIDLDATTRDLDELLATLDPKDWHHDARREVLVNYLGFPFWDVLTFSLMSTRESGEFNEILVDRISPQDARALKGFGGSVSLKGTGFGHFAAFLSRSYRENDYLMGRLHALDRLIDIVCDSAGIDERALDIVGLKKRGFLRIIAAEDPHLRLSKPLIAALQRAIAQME